MDPSVYRDSVIVRHVSAAIKEFIRRRKQDKQDFAVVRSASPDFLHSKESNGVSRAAGRNVDKEGYILPDGALLAEQSNGRLKNTDNRFHLVAHNSVATEKSIATRWRVDSVYDFEPFEKAAYFTNIPLSDSKILKIPDGLSHYMTVLKIAAAFDYWAEWNETWHV